MQAVYYTQFQQRPEITELADPQPAPGGVVVEVKASGVCRSDWHGWMRHDADIVLPHVPGHELAGVIVAVGADVKKWSTGDRVTVPFVGGCGTCEDCRHGDPQVCRRQFQPGFTAWGSFADFVAIDYADQNLVALPDNMDFATAAGLGCRFGTAFRAVVDQGRLRNGETVSVFGCGGVGLSAIMIANALGANVIAVDVADDALQLAASMGANTVINSKGMRPDDVASAIRDATGGANLSIDAIGHSETSHAAITGLKRRGRHVQVGLMTAEHAHAALPWPAVVARELEIIGSHGIQAARYNDIFAMIEKGELKPDRLIGKRIRLAGAIDEMLAMGAGAPLGMTVIEFG